MACTNFNNLTPRRVLRVPDVQQTSTGETIKKFLSLAKEEGRLILRNVAIRLRRPLKRRGPPSLSSLQKKKLKLRCFSSVRTGEEPRAKKCSVSAIHNSWRGRSRIDNRS
jgi:ribosomal protein L18E